MLRRWSSLIVLAGLLVTLLPRPAIAYVDIGHDPDDREPIGYDPDIRSTTRRMVKGEAGWRLAIVVRAYEDFGLYWFIEAKLDTRGGLKTDYIMQLYNADQSGRDCYVHKKGDSNPGDWVDGWFRQTGDKAKCRVPAHTVDPNKHIRWRLVSESGYVNGNKDFAPNWGWYE